MKNKIKKIEQDNQRPISRLVFRKIEKMKDFYPEDDDFYISISKSFSTKISVYPFYKTINREL